MPLAQSFERGGLLGTRRSPAPATAATLTAAAASATTSTPSETTAASAARGPGLVRKFYWLSGRRKQQAVANAGIHHRLNDDVEQTLPGQRVVTEPRNADLHAMNLRRDLAQRRGNRQRGEG